MGHWRKSAWRRKWARVSYRVFGNVDPPAFFAFINWQGMSILPPPADESERLEALRRYDILDTPPEDGFDRATRLTVQLMDVPIALVSFLDEDRQWFKSCRGLYLRETNREIAFCAHDIYNDRVLVVEDVREDARFANNPLVTGEPGIRFYAGAPLITGEGHVVGSLCALDTEPRQVSDRKIEGLRDLAEMVVTQLEIRAKNRELREQHRKVKSLSRDLKRAEEANRSELSELVQEDLQQVLQAARMQLDGVCSQDTRIDGQSDRLERVVQTLDDAVDITRHLSSNFAPPVGSQPLRDTFEWLGAKMEATHGLSVSVQGNGTAVGSAEAVKKLMYQTVRELLFRVVPDAETNDVQVHLSENAKHLRVTVEDAGHGFDLGQEGGSLADLWEQIEERGGRLEARARSHKGTRVTIEVPKGESTRLPAESVSSQGWAL